MTKAKAGKAASREHDGSRKHHTQQAQDEATPQHSASDDSSVGASTAVDAGNHNTERPASTAKAQEDAAKAHRGTTTPPRDTAPSSPAHQATQEPAAGPPRGAMTHRYTVWASAARQMSGSDTATATSTGGVPQQTTNSQPADRARSRRRTTESTASRVSDVTTNITSVPTAGTPRATPPGLDVTTFPAASNTPATGGAGPTPIVRGRIPRPRMAQRATGARESETIPAANSDVAEGITALPGATDATSHPDMRATGDRSPNRRTGTPTGTSSRLDATAGPSATAEAGEHRILPFQREHSAPNRDRDTETPTTAARPPAGVDAGRGGQRAAPIEAQAHGEADEVARERKGRVDGEEHTDGDDEVSGRARAATANIATDGTDVANDLSQTTGDARESLTASAEEVRDSVAEGTRQTQEDISDAFSGLAGTAQHTAHDVIDRAASAGTDTTATVHDAVRTVAETARQAVDDVARTTSAAASDIGNTVRQSGTDARTDTAASVSRAQAHIAATATTVAGTVSGTAHDMAGRASEAAARLREPATRTAHQMRGVLTGTSAPGAAATDPSTVGDLAGSPIGAATRQPATRWLGASFALLTLTGLSRRLVRTVTGADIRVLGPRQVHGKLLGAGLIAIIAGWLFSRKDQAG